MKKIISILLSICIAFSLCTFSVISSNAEATTEYKDEFSKFALGNKYEEYKDDVYYKEYYRYFSEDNNTDIPDWIFGMGYTPFSTLIDYWAYLDNYAIFSGAYLQPFTCGYFVYVPAENKFYDLERAWNSGYENLDLALEYCIINDVEGIYHLSDVKNVKYFDKFHSEYFNNTEFDRNYVVRAYDELCYGYGDEQNEDSEWVLINCGVDPAPSMLQYGIVVGNRVLTIIGGGCLGFVDGYGVYIKSIDSFITLRQSSLDQVIELCPNFVETIEEKEIGRAFGDVDENGKIDVFDATAIQRYLAEYGELPYYNQVHVYGKGDKFFSDFDRDGETTVLDATAIQRHIAGLE